MTTAFGIIGIAVFIVCVIVLAAAVTWLVVKLTPGDRSKRDSAADAAR